MAKPTFSAATTFGSAESGGTVTIASVSIPANGLLLVKWGLRPGDPDNRTVTGVTFDGNAMTSVGSHESGESPPNVRGGIFRYVSAPGATGDVVLTLSVGAAQIGGVCETYSGVDQTTPLGSFATNVTVSGEAPSISQTMGTDQILSDFLTRDTFEGGDTPVVGAAQTATQNAQYGARVWVAASYQTTGSGSQAMSWSWTGAEAFAHMSVQINGISAGSAFSITAEFGSYTLTGQTANLLAGGFISAESGSYTLIGSEALRDVEMNADAGDYDLNGQDAELLSTLLLIAASGSYALTGQSANLLYSLAASIERPKRQRRMYGFRLGR